MRNLILVAVVLATGCAAHVETSGSAVELEQAQLTGTWQLFMGACYARYTFEGSAYAHELHCNGEYVDLEHGSYQATEDAVRLVPSFNMCGEVDAYTLGLVRGSSRPWLNAEQPGDLQPATEVRDPDCDASAFADSLEIRRAHIVAAVDANE